MISQTAATSGVAGTSRDYAAEQRRWEERALQRALSHGERQQAFTTGSGIEVGPLYGPAQLDGHDPVSAEGFPGAPPFTRGIQATMYRGRLWSIRQYAGYGTARDANERFRFLLANGQKGLSVAFDLPTQMGLDSDDRRAAGEVGQVGVAIDSVADMEELFAEIPLDAVSTSMTINAPAPVLVAMYIVAAERQGVPAEAVMGTAQNDVLKEYVARGTYIYPPRPSLRLAADLIAHCARHAPRFNAISLSGYHIREAGSTAPQEMAFAVANACEYVTAVVERGIAIDDFAPKLSWIFNTHTDFFEEIAKYRALRRVWARVMSERFGATDPRSLMLRTHTQTGGSTLTAQQPENNIVRAAIQALAATLGGVQSMALSCYDEALSIPTQKAQRIAVRTQQIIGEEIGVTNTVDPLGGSYFVEWLTDELERRATALLAQVDELGGAVACIEFGVDAGADPGGGVSRRARHGVGPEGGGGRQQVHRDRGSAGAADLSHRRTRCRRATRAPAGPSAAPPGGGGDACVGGATHCRRRRRRAHAGDPRRGARRRHARRDLRHAARCLR